MGVRTLCVWFPEWPLGSYIGIQLPQRTGSRISRICVRWFAFGLTLLIQFDETFPCVIDFTTYIEAFGRLISKKAHRNRQDGP